MIVVVARDEEGSVLRRMAVESEAGARRWMAEFLAEMGSGSVVVDETDRLARPVRRISTAWVR